MVWSLVLPRVISNSIVACGICSRRIHKCQRDKHWKFSAFFCKTHSWTLWHGRHITLFVGLDSYWKSTHGSWSILRRHFVWRQSSKFKNQSFVPYHSSLVSSAKVESVSNSFYQSDLETQRLSDSIQGAYVESKQKIRHRKNSGTHSKSIPRPFRRSKARRFGRCFFAGLYGCSVCDEWIHETWRRKDFTEKSQSQKRKGDETIQRKKGVHKKEKYEIFKWVARTSFGPCCRDRFGTYDQETPCDKKATDRSHCGWLCVNLINGVRCNRNSF